MYVLIYIITRYGIFWPPCNHILFVTTPTSPHPPVARAAAIKRATGTSTSHQATPTHSLHSVPMLEALCTRLLVSVSRSHDFPSCSSLTPMVAQRLLSSFMKEKRLNSKVLASFHGWWVTCVCVCVCVCVRDSLVSRYPLPPPRHYMHVYASTCTCTCTCV